MSTMIPATKLAEGDLYRGVGLGRVERGQVFRVVKVRTITTAASYRHIEAVNVDTGNRSSIDLRADVTVARLDYLGTAQDAAMAVRKMDEGDTLHLVRHNERYWF